MSDFGLNDAIESGLVKTPRVVVRDDSGQYSQDYKSRLFHIYADEEVRANITRAAEPQESLPARPLVCTRSLGVVDCWRNPEALGAAYTEVADGARSLTPAQEANRTRRWPGLW